MTHSHQYFETVNSYWNEKFRFIRFDKYLYIKPEVYNLGDWVTVPWDKNISIENRAKSGRKTVSSADVLSLKNL